MSGNLMQMRIEPVQLGVGAVRISGKLEQIGVGLVQLSDHRVQVGGNHVQGGRARHAESRSAQINSSASSSKSAAKACKSTGGIRTISGAFVRVGVHSLHDSRNVQCSRRRAQ
jgi:hypothetical protein